MSVKGDRDRTKDRKRYCENFEKIDFGKQKLSEPVKEENKK